MEGIKNYFQTGRGSIRVRAKLSTETPKGGKENIIVHEIPFNVNRSELVSRIADLVNSKELTEVTDVRDESDENTRVVIELKRDAVTKVVINKLYKMTALETSFAVNQLAIDGGRPKTLNLKELINCYIEHRREVVMRRTRFELREAQRRAEALEGYLIALANLDEVIKIIRKAADREEARAKLAAYNFTRAEAESFGIAIHAPSRLANNRYLISAEQVTAILELRLYQLTGLERDKIIGEYKELLKKITDLIDILAKEIRVLSIIKKELEVIRDKHGNERRTQIVPDEGEMNIEDLIANEGVIITITHNSLIKRTNISSYRAQRRGGRGVIGMTTRGRRQAGGRRFRRASLHRLHARLPDVLHQHRPRLRRAGARDSRHGPRRQGPLHRQFPRDEAGRENRRAHPRRVEARPAGQRRDLEIGQLPPLRHPDGHGEENFAGRFRQHAQGRHHRHRHRAGRQSHRGAPDHRHERGGADHPRGG